MSKGKLERWALIAEIAGGVAVVFSLLLVAYEIRESNREAVLTRSAIEMSAYQSLIEDIFHLNDVLINNPELNSAFRRIHDIDEVLSIEEEGILKTYMMSTYRHGDTAYFHFQKGAIDIERLDSLLKIVIQRLDTTWARNHWETFKYNFHPEYVKYIDSKLEVVE